MRKKLLAVVLVAVMVLSLVACGTKPTTPAATNTPVPSTPTPEPTKAPVKAEPSVTFEDGKMDFVAVFQNFTTADASTLEIADFNGSKALKITKAKENLTPIVAFDVASLLGDKAADVVSVSASIGTSYEDKSFNATAGQILLWTDTNLSKMEKADWSVYTARKNPYEAKVAVPEDVKVGEAAPLVLIYFKEDLGVGTEHGPATYYVDDLTFLDKDGKTIKPASTEVAFNAPAGFKNEKPDRKNLKNLGSIVEFAGFAKKGAAWSQDGFEMPQEFIDALVPGSTIEISYSAPDGKIWVVFPDAKAGWSRVGDGTWAGNAHTEVFRNAGCTVAQIDYEQIVAICGEDKTTWGARLQCEGASDWEVFSVKVGVEEEEKVFVADVEFPGFTAKNDAWSQKGFEFTPEVFAALVPGSVIEFNFTSEDGTLWAVLPNATAGWSRVGDADYCGNKHDAALLVDGSKCYVTYEQIVAICGEDKTTWGPQLQAESRTAWEVFSVNIGHFEVAGEKEFKKTIEFPGFTVKNDAWSQKGLEFTAEVLDALVPGSVIEFNFTSEDGTLWAVLPNATAGWSRVGDADYCGNKHDAALLVDGSKCYVTYEQIVAICGEDKTTWGPQLQAESRTAWEVFSVNIGTMEPVAQAPRLHDYVDFEGFTTSGNAWGQNGFDMPQAFIDALVPGSVIEIDYASEDGTLWVVFPNAAAGWSRVGDANYCGNGHDAAILVDGNKCYVTYEQIVAICGEDKTTWGAQLQGEARTAWEIYSVKIGQTK